MWFFIVVPKNICSNSKIKGSWDNWYRPIGASMIDILDHIIYSIKIDTTLNKDIEYKMIDCNGLYFQLNDRKILENSFGNCAIKRCFTSNPYTQILTDSYTTVELENELYKIYINRILRYVGNINSNGLFDKKGIMYYDNEYIMYDGELSNGKMDGYGTIYYYTGEKYYRGEWMDGKINGNGTSYYENGKLRYEGEWRNGLYNGHGSLYYENGSRNYEGIWLNGIRHGRGIQYYENGNKAYEGEFENDIKEGYGIAYCENGIEYYSGTFNDGMIQ
jgi:antitoxin component YwqK of YwqJK toxin-antitoxin module